MKQKLTFKNPSAAHVTEESGEGIAIAYTMGSMKIAGNRNEVSNNGWNLLDQMIEMTEIAVSFRILIQFRNYRKSPNLLGLFFVQNLN